MATQDSNHVDLRQGTLNHIQGDQVNVQISPTDSSDLYQLLDPANAGCDRSGPVARCMIGTREDLIAKILQWIGMDSAPPICWLNGPAGYGKSAVSQTVGEYCDVRNQMAASFFFMRGADNRSTIASLVPTLAYQLSISVPATKPLLQKALQRDPAITKKALRHQFKKLMVCPIFEGEIQRTEPMVIIVDALDECDDKGLMEEFIEVVTDACREIRPFPFRVFLTSRVEEHLRKKLEALAARSIIYPLDLTNFDASDDIRKFFQFQFSTIYEENHELMIMREISWPWPSNSILEALIEKAEGSFLCATKFLNSIDVKDMPRQKLITLRANTDSRRLSWSGILRPFRRLSRSSSQQTSASEESSHVALPSSPIGSIPEIAAVASEALDASGVIGSAQTEQSSRAHSSGASIPSDTHESAMSNELPRLSEGEDGFVEATISESLIEQLIMDFPSIREMEDYRDTFFTTYTGFTTTGAVFQSLVRRFHEAETSPTQHRVNLRTNIIAAMKYWVTNPSFKVDTNILARMDQFAMSIQSPQTMEKMAKQLHLAVTEHPISQSLLHATTSQEPTNPTTPLDLAIALLMLEGDKYTRILPADYISYFQHQSGNNNIRDAFETNNSITYWVKQQVLRCDDLQSRSDVLTFYVYTAEESRKLYNFASMSAIVTALESSILTCLDLTFDLLPRDCKRLIKQMRYLLNPDDNYGAYMAILKGSNNLPCIPLLAVHLNDMRTAFYLAQDVVHANGMPTINFPKWTEFHTSLKDILRHKCPDISAHRQKKTGVLKYLERHLRDISVGSDMDQALEKLSRNLWHNEELQRQLGIPGLNAVGMD